ncbi:SRPBCC family protein [Streptosporangium sp. NBC_01495]|uniref:SRPBCC family protein n=1 Tax=Streptosporangium sp. NBC_01495 TaxID=2903899 RepID=UPI002E316F98|nr:SRPBCC family protein [Streptosporangium sp. NBC_01495]
MPKVTLRNTFHVRNTPEALRAHLSQPQSYVGLSPMVVAVKDVERGESETRYTSVERFRFFGLVKYDNMIKVTLRSTPRTVEGEVDSPGGVRLDYRFTLNEKDGGTEVEDILVVHAWVRPLLGYAAKKAREVQLARAGVLASRLESAS